MILERSDGTGRLRIEDGFDFTLEAILVETSSAEWVSWDRMGLPVQHNLCNLPIDDLKIQKYTQSGEVSVDLPGPRLAQKGSQDAAAIRESCYRNHNRPCAHRRGLLPRKTG